MVGVVTAVVNGGTVGVVEMVGGVVVVLVDVVVNVTLKSSSTTENNSAPLLCVEIVYMKHNPVLNNSGVPLTLRCP